MIPGKFVVSPGSILRLDLTGLDVQSGEVIPLFTFSSATGSFDSIEIESTTCRTLFAVLERTETTMNAVVLSSTSVCAAQVKAAIHSPH